VLTNVEVQIIAATVETRVAERFELRFDEINQQFVTLKRKLHDLADVMQGMAESHALRLERIEQSVGAAGQSR
jgi:hypothetical protein